MKKIIIITGFPGVGKTTIGKELSKALKGAFLDKDTISDKFTNLITKNITFEHDKESDFYKKEIRDLEYEVTMDVAVEQLEFLDNIIIVGPFTKELKIDSNFFDNYKKKIGNKNIKAEILFFNIVCSEEDNKKRIKNRDLPEDRLKINDWNNYFKNKSNIDIRKDIHVIKNNDIKYSVNEILNRIK